VEDLGSVSEPLDQVLTQARHVLSSSETDWSSEQRHEIETLVNDIEQLHDLVFICSSCLIFTDLFLYSAFTVTDTTDQNWCLSCFSHIHLSDRG